MTVRLRRRGPEVSERLTFEDHPLPDLGSRWWGRFVDGIVIGLPLSLIVLTALHGLVARLLLVVPALLIYEGVCVSIWGQTAGKRIARTRVVPVRFGNPRPGPAQAFFRTAVVGVPSLLLVLPRPAGILFYDLAFAVIWLPILRQRQRRGLPDLLAGTIVVDARTYRQSVPDGAL